MKRSTLLGSAAALLLVLNAGAHAASDEEFLQAAIGINLAEIDAGKLAQEKGEADGVKRYGEALVTDHTRANEEARRLATSLGMTPAAPSDPARTGAAALQQFTGAQFDDVFAKHMAMGHREAIALFEDKADDGDGAVSAFAKGMLPVLQKHLDTAEALGAAATAASAPSVSGGAAMSGAGTGSEPLEGAETGSRPLEGAPVVNPYPMEGTGGSQ